MAPDAYLATWDLIPELSLYAQGQPPAEGEYRLEAVDGRIQVNIRWRMAEGDPWQSTAFAAPPDGSRQALPPGPPGAPDAFSLLRQDAHTLDSSAWVGEIEVAWARRRVSRDGTLMAVVQETRLPDGRALRNLQVYRRRSMDAT